MQDKRGLSTIIVTLIIILLSLVAVGVVWVVVSNILKSGTQQTSSEFGQLLINLALQNVNMKSNGDVDVSVKRNVGAGDLTGIKFIVSDGVNTKVIEKDTTMNELETNTFTINSSELGNNFGFIKEVSIAPVLRSGTGNIMDTKNISTKNVLANLGAVSWWKLDGNINDEFGVNNGISQVNVSFVDGKYGEAGDFNGLYTSAGSYIDCGNSSSLRISGEMTVFACVYTTAAPVTQGRTIMGIISSIYGYVLGTVWITNDSFFQVFNVTSSSGYRAYPNFFTSGVGLNQWKCLMGVYKPSQYVKMYSDGVLISNITTNVIPSIIYNSSSPDSFMIGRRSNPQSNFQGKIDEVIVFNKALTDQQVKAFYNLDLTDSS